MFCDCNSPCIIFKLMSGIRTFVQILIYMHLLCIFRYELSMGQHHDLIIMFSNEDDGVICNHPIVTSFEMKRKHSVMPVFDFIIT